MAEFLNKNIKYLRNIKGLSQQGLADKVGVDRSTISRIENSEIETTIDNALKIARVLGVELQDLIGCDLTNENNMMPKQFTEEEKKEALKQVLKDKGFLNDNEEMSSEDFNRLIDFAKRNKDFIVDKKDG